jgi:uncharacterized SAM-binding protein YcdF (DUF218 family)
MGFAVSALWVAVLMDQLVLRWRGGAVRLRVGLVMAMVAAVAMLVATLPPWALLQKILGRLAMPSGLLWLAAATTAIHGLGRRRPIGWIMALFFVGYTLAGNDPLGSTLLAALERNVAPLQLETLEPFEAVLVMGGGVDETPSGAPQLIGTGDRVRVGLWLLRAGKALRLVTTGGRVPGMKRRYPTSQLTAQIWRDLGATAEQLIELDQPYNSTQEIEAFAALVRERRWQRVGLISSAWHLPRCAVLARRHGLTVTLLPADWRGVVHWDGAYSLIPCADGFATVQMACWELLGRAVGR